MQLQHQSRLSKALKARRREAEKLSDMMGHAEWIRRDFDRERLYAGLPLAFTAVAVYGNGLSPLTLPFSEHLLSWHISSRGITQAATLINSNGAGPTLNWDAPVNQSLSFQCDITGSGNRGVATYGLTVTGGPPYFQTGTTAVTVPVPLFGQSLIFPPGPFTAGLDVYNGLISTLNNQTPNNYPLVGAVTDSSKPRLLPNQQNGYPAILSAGGTSGGMTNDTTWAADLCSGVTSRDFITFGVFAADSAVPSAVRAFWSFGNSAAANPAYYFGTRNGTNNYRAAHINDAGTATNREAGAISTDFQLYTVQQLSGNVSVWVNTVNIVNGLSFGTGATTLDRAALFCLYRNSAQTNNGAHKMLEFTTYDGVPTADQRGAIEQYFMGKYLL